MKVALLLHGLTRRYDISYPFIKENIIDKFNADTFISCWDNQVKEEEVGKGENLSLKKMISLYNPTAYDQEIYNDQIEESFISKKYLKIFEQPKVHYKNNWSRFFAFYYKVWKANHLRNEYEKINNIKYDLVIKWRTDVFIKDVLTHDLLEQFNKNDKAVFMPFGHGGDGYINDLVYIAKPSVMDKICDLYFNLEKVAEYVAPQPSNEKHLLVWLYLNNIQMNHFYIDWEYITFRPDFRIRTLNKDNILNINI